MILFGNLDRVSCSSLQRPHVVTKNIVADAANDPPDPLIPVGKVIQIEMRNKRWEFRFVGYEETFRSLTLYPALVSYPLRQDAAGILIHGKSRGHRRKVVDREGESAKGSSSTGIRQ